MPWRELKPMDLKVMHIADYCKRSMNPTFKALS